MADSFQGGVHIKGDARGELRARIALVGSNVEALTGDETFRIPQTRCDVTLEAERIVIRDLEGTIAIWSDDAPFLDALERTRHTALKRQVARIRNTRRRRRLINWGAKGLIAAGIVLLLSLPMMRWAVGGGVSAVTDHIGQSALQQLHLPSGQAPLVERQLEVMAEQLRPTALLGKHTLRVLLADYADVHTFHMPPDVVVVTSALICNADAPGLVTAAVALELAHLEARDVNAQMPELVDWRTSLGMLSGDTTKLREYMLNFADSRRAPAYTPEQETAAHDRAMVILNQAAVPLLAGQDAATLLARAKDLHADPADAGALPPENTENPLLMEWYEVRNEACGIVGR